MNILGTITALLLSACSVNVTTIDIITVRDNDATVLLASSGGPKGPAIRCSNAKHNSKVQRCVQEVEERLGKKLSGRLYVYVEPATGEVNGQKVAREPKSGKLYRGWVTTFGRSSSSVVVVGGEDGEPTCEATRWEAGRVILWQHGVKDEAKQEAILNAAGLRGWG